MKKHTLPFRQVDRDKFEALGRGKKKVETRAASVKYQKILAGDILVFKCGKERFEKTVKKISAFKDVDSFLKSINGKI